ncbi:glycosyltransferase, partial [Paraprevotella xylaniphila]
MCVSIPVRHYLLTRFNLPLWNKDKRGLVTRDEVWLEDRCRLFEQYTLPSVLQQSCKDFTWVVLFDGDTPPVYRERVKGWAERCENFKYVPVKAEYARF